MNTFRFLGPSLGLSIVLALTACSSPVSSIQVKAKPTLYASLGQYTYQMSSYLSPSKLESMLGNPTGLSVYSYQPATKANPAPQEYALHYPLLSVPLDVGSNMSNLNLSSMITTNIPSQSFTIPAINQTVTAPISLDINSILRNTVNGSLTAQNASVGETGLPSPPAASLSIPLTFSNFSSLTVSTGSLSLTFSALNNPTPGLSLSITQIALVSGPTTISSSTTAVNMLKGGTATLPFTASTTLPANVSVKLTISTSGGTTGHLDSFTMQAGLSTDFTISSASGVNFSTSVNIPAVSMPFNAASNFVSATIASNTVSSPNNLILTPGTFPTSWNGFAQSLSVNVTQTGGLNLSQSGTGNLTFDLSNQTLSANTISLGGTLQLTATNASLSGLSGPVTLSNSAAITLSQFASVVVKPGSSFNPNFVIDYNLLTSLSTQQQQMWQWVNYIDFSSLGFNLSFTNNLPAGNDMSMTIQSQAFGISQTATLASNATTPASFLSGSTSTPYQYIPSHDYGHGADVIDLSVNLQPKSWNSSTGELTLYNISPGSTLTFSATLTPVTTWTQASISPQTSGYNGTFPTSGSYDLSTLTTYLGSNFSFPTLPAYLYVSAPISITGFTAYLQAQYTNNGVLTKTDLVGTSTTPALVNLLPAQPTTFTADGGSLTSLPSASLTVPDLSVPLNAKPKDLVLNYALNMGSITITPSSISGSSSAVLEADIVVPLPLQFTIPAGGATLNFNGTSGTDFFGRTSPTSTTVNNLLNQLTSMTLTLGVDNNTGFTGSATLTDGTGFSKSITLTSGPSSISLTLSQTDIQHIISTIPFTPSLQVTLGSTTTGETVVIPVTGLTASASVTAVADINQTYQF